MKQIQSNSQARFLIGDRIAALIDRETKYTTPKRLQSLKRNASTSYRDSPSSIHCTQEIDKFQGDVRLPICEWMYKVVDHYSLERDLIPIAMSYFDRYVANNPRRCNQKGKYQLLAITSLYTAVKLHGTDKRGTLECFSILSNGRFSTNDIEAQERLLINDLNWLMNPPTPQAFVFDFVDYLSTTIEDDEVQRIMSNIYEVASYIVEVALFRSPVSQEKASTLAFASFLIVLGELKQEQLSSDHYEAIVSSICSFEFATSENVATVVHKLMDTLKTSNGYADMQEIYKKIDTECVLFYHASV